VSQVLDSATIPASQIATSKFTITQESKCMATFSKNPSAPTSLTVDHDLPAYNGVIVDNIDKIFKNSDALNCPFKTCKLLQKGCKVDADPTGSVKMSDKMPFAILVGENALPDLKEGFCVQCENGYKTIEYDELVVM